MMTHNSSIMILLFNILYIGITLSATCDHNACVYVKNECEFSLYNHRFLTVLESNDETVFDISSWYGEGSEELDVWYGNPVDGKVDHSTVFINYGCYNEEKMCYNASISGLPVQIGPYNKADCPEIDDVSQQGGYKECSTNFLSVTFCADAPQSDYDYDEMVASRDSNNNINFYNNNEREASLLLNDEMEPSRPGYDEMKSSRLLNDEMERIKYYSNNNIYNNDEMDYDEMMESDSNNNNNNNNNNNIKSSDAKRWIYNNGIIKNENNNCLQRNGDDVRYSKCNGQDSQKWYYLDNHIMATPGSDYKCLDIENIDGNDIVILSRCSNDDTQDWMIESHSMEPSPLLNDDYDMMMESDSDNNNNNNNNIKSLDGNCLSIDIDSQKIYSTGCVEAKQTLIYNNGIIGDENGYCLVRDGGDVGYCTCNGDRNEIWFYYVESGHMTSYVDGDLKCLNRAGNDIVILSDCNNSESWRIG